MTAVWKRLAVGLLLLTIADSGRSEDNGRPGSAASAPRHDASATTSAADHDAVVDSIGIKLVKIPAGEFLMGNRESKEELRNSFPQYDAERFEVKFDDEYPVHRVRITKPFYLGATAATVGQFRCFVSETKYKTDAERSDPANDTPGEPRRIGPGGYGYNKETGKLDERRNPEHI